MKNKVQIIFKKTRKLFNSIFQVQESREIHDLKFDTGAVHEVKDIIKYDKEESDALENDIQRLENLRNVHEQSADTFNKIKALQQSQANLINGLQDDEKALGYIKESLQENIATIKENMQNIRDRINKLKQ